MAQTRTFFQSKARQEKISKTIVYFLLTLGAIVFMIPFFWMLSTAVKPMSQVYVFPPVWIPHPIRWDNIPKALAAAPWLTYLRNTAIYSASTVVGASLSACLVGFSFARLRWPGRDFIFIIILSTMMLPAQVTMVPLYIFYAKLHWVNSLKPLIVPAFFGGGAFFIFLARQFFMTIPLELDDAAKIDGCDTFRIFWNIMLPMSKPLAATIAIFQFMGAWNDFMGPLIYLKSPDKWTITLGMRLFQSLHGEAQTNYMMVIATLAMLPCLLLFFVAQRYFIQGVVVSGVKG